MARKRKEATITKKQIKDALIEYKKRGGKITKITPNDVRCAPVFGKNMSTDNGL